LEPEPSEAEPIALGLWLYQNDAAPYGSGSATLIEWYKINYKNFKEFCALCMMQYCEKTKNNNF
jgi:hypothetical protein